MSKHETKTCTRCRVPSPKSEFYRSTITDDGLFDMCMRCCRIHLEQVRGNMSRRTIHYANYMNAPTGSIQGR